MRKRAWDLTAVAIAVTVNLALFTSFGTLTAVLCAIPVGLAIGMLVGTLERWTR